MRWYSVKKFNPLIGGEYIVTDGDFVYSATYSPGNVWIDSSKDDDEEESQLRRITHFCIPDPIEIEE